MRLEDLASKGVSQDSASGNTIMMLLEAEYTNAIAYNHINELKRDIDNSACVNKVQSSQCRRRPIDTATGRQTRQRLQPV